MSVRKTAAWLVPVHNHPSCDTMPGQQDIFFIKRFVQAGLILDIPVIDLNSGKEEGKGYDMREFVIEYHYKDGDIGAHFAEDLDLCREARKLWKVFMTAPKADHVVIRPSKISCETGKRRKPCRK